MPTPVEKLGASIPAEIIGPTTPPSNGALDRFRVPATYGYGIHEEQIEFLALLRRHRNPVIGILLLCLVAGLLYARLASKSYKAQTVLEITGVNQNFLNTSEVDPNAGGVAPDSYLETQIKLLQNDVLVDRVIESMAPKVPSSLAVGGKDKEDVIRKMLSGVKAREEGQSNLVRIVLLGPDPKLVANTANELTSQYIQQGQNARLTAASETGVFLKQQLEDAKNKLQNSEDALQQYASASGIVLTNETHEPVSTEHLREIQQGLSQAQIDHANRQAQVEMISNASLDSLPQIIDDPTLREDRSKLTDLRRQLAELSTTMTPSNYRVQKVQAQIQDIEAEMQRHKATIRSRLIVEDRAAVRREELLRDAYRQQLAVVADQGSKQVRYNMLRHDVDVNLEVYQTMLQKVKEAGVIAALRAANARIVSPAKVPLLPYSPKISICMLIAALSGIGCSLLYILVSERMDKSVRSPGQSERYIDRPELAVIPRAHFAVKHSRAPLRLDVSNGVRSKRMPPMLEHWKEADRTFLAEAYRSAGTSILFSKNGAVSPKVLLLTSPQPRCGKTTISANLAVSLAEGGRRVLLIDGDLRRPALANLFGVRNAEGLTDTLDENHPVDANNLIRTTDFPGVKILPSGPVRSSVAKLLHSSRLGPVINTMRNDYDFILIDAPPLLGLADARILSKFTDGVVLVCRAGQTNIDELDEARRLLAEDGTHILGTILNDCDLQRERYPHSNSYSKYLSKMSA